MAIGDLTINGILIPGNFNLKFSQGYIDFEETQRTIDKTLVSDFASFKRIFNISWTSFIQGDLLADFLDMYIAKDDVTFVVSNADGTDSTYICKLSISNEFLREIKVGDFAYSGFTLTLEEV